MAAAKRRSRRRQHAPKDSADHPSANEKEQEGSQPFARSPDPWRDDTGQLPPQQGHPELKEPEVPGESEPPPEAGGHDACTDGDRKGVKPKGQ